MKYKQITRGLTLLTLLAGFLTGFLMQACEEQTIRTASVAEKQVPIYFVETGEKKLAISFDAAWGCEHTVQILDTLQKYDVKATFFLTDIWLADYPEMARKIAEQGHEIAMHSMTHPHMSQISESEAAAEIDGNRQTILEITGYEADLFRFPFGEYDNKSINLLLAKGYYPVQWSIDSLDWMESKTAEDIIDRVTLGLHPGAIILCHNNGTYTAEAINQIIPFAQREGYQFVPVGELIYREVYQVNPQGMQLMPEKKDGENGSKAREE